MLQSRATGVCIAALLLAAASCGPVPVELTVTRLGDGEGTVTSRPGLLQCGDDVYFHVPGSAASWALTLDGPPQDGKTFSYTVGSFTYKMRWEESLISY